MVCPYRTVRYSTAPPYLGFGQRADLTTSRPLEVARLGRSHASAVCSEGASILILNPNLIRPRMDQLPHPAHEAKRSTEGAARHDSCSLAPPVGRASEDAVRVQPTRMGGTRGRNHVGLARSSRSRSRGGWSPCREALRVIHGEQGRRQTGG